MVSPSCEAGRELGAPTVRVGLRERLLSRLLGRIRIGRLTVSFPSGAERRFGSPGTGPEARARIHDLRVLRRIMVSGDLGLAESYIDGDWESPDLEALLLLGTLNAETLEALFQVSWPSLLLNRVRHARRANTRAGSRRNISAHYDLGNAFYRLWLDDTMSYSAALFEKPDETMETAQLRKYRRLAERLGLREGDRVLEIGCGWGGFAELAAAEYGCSVVGLTLSSEQAGHARARMTAAGLEDAVEIRLQDYRDVAGQFDKIVSIEMFEAVGERNWPDYFAVLDRCLKPGGRAGLQVITIADARFDSYRRCPDFIQTHVFPGGMLPSPSAFAAAVGKAGLRIAEGFTFGASYAETLRRWDRAFLRAWPKAERLGYDARFKRLWHYYLGYCAVGFDRAQLDVGQFVIERP